MVYGFVINQAVKPYKFRHVPECFRNGPLAAGPPQLSRITSLCRLCRSGRFDHLSLSESNYEAPHIE